MEQEKMLKEILHVLKVHSEQVEKRFVKLETKMDNMKAELESKIDGLASRIDNLESRMDKGFERLGKKFNGVRVDLTETQETTDFVFKKTAQHEKTPRAYQKLALPLILYFSNKICLHATLPDWCEGIFIYG